MTIFLDSNIVIYAVERDAAWASKVDRRLLNATHAGDLLAGSEATRFECIVAPLRVADTATLAKYHRFFSSPSSHFYSVTTAVWGRAAQIRAQFGFGAMDAIHFATAIEFGCGLFLTADARLAKFPDIPVEVIS